MLDASVFDGVAVPTFFLGQARRNCFVLIDAVQDFNAKVFVILRYLVKVARLCGRLSTLIFEFLCLFK